MGEQEFVILSRFLADHPTVVEGRAAMPLSSSEEQALIKLAAGELDEKDATQLMPLLEKNATALVFLAQQIKSRRGPPRGERGAQ